jgi:hypothetical protein
MAEKQFLKDELTLGEEEEEEEKKSLGISERGIED